MNEVEISHVPCYWFPSRKEGCLPREVLLPEETSVDSPGFTGSCLGARWHCTQCPGYRPSWASPGHCHSGIPPASSAFGNGHLKRLSGVGKQRCCPGSKDGLGMKNLVLLVLPIPLNCLHTAWVPFRLLSVHLMRK